MPHYRRKRRRRPRPTPLRVVVETLGRVSTATRQLGLLEGVAPKPAKKAQARKEEGSCPKPTTAP